MRPLGAVPSLERLRWIHEQAPAECRSLLLWDGERVAGHFGLAPQRVWMDGREVLFSQLAHCFCLPEYGLGLSHRSNFVQLAEAFFEAHGGPQGDLCYYGLPSYGEWRIGKKVLGYESLRLEGLLECATSEGPSELPEGVESMERFDHQARWLWDRCASEFGALGIRDDAFLNWRFSEHPEASYEFLGVRDAEGVLRGYAVYGMGSWQGRECALIHDWLVPEAEPQVAEKLHAGALALARRDGQTHLATLLPERSHWYTTFQTWGHRVRPAETFTLAKVFQRKFNVLWLRDNWWYTLADLV